ARGQEADTWAQRRTAVPCRCPREAERDPPGLPEPDPDGLSRGWPPAESSLVWLGRRLSLPASAVPTFLTKQAARSMHYTYRRERYLKSGRRGRYHKTSSGLLALPD